MKAETELNRNIALRKDVKLFVQKQWQLAE
jgi:hypothetical protein